MPLLHTDPTLKTIFPQGCIKSVFKENQSLTQFLTPSLYPNKNIIRTNSITSCSKCDIWKNYLICSNYFTCSVYNRRYYAKVVLRCNCNNVIYLITCIKCLGQYVGSATNFKNHFTIHESNIKTNKDRCGTANHFNGMCENNSNSLFKLWNKFIVMPQTLKKFYDAGKNIGKTSYLLRLMVWTVWLTSTVLNVRDTGSKFL